MRMRGSTGERVGGGGAHERVLKRRAPRVEEGARRRAEAPSGEKMQLELQLHA